MSELSIKNAAITRTGYDYQDLIGIEILIEYYRDPDRYEWVQLESEDSDFGALEDVVAALPDGTFELAQVKFTPRPDIYLLNWEWLLEKKPKGTSRLQKWAASLQALTLKGKVKSACLRTNRRPDVEFAKSLRNTFIDLDAIDASVRTEIEGQLGGADETSSFFTNFAFKHSEKMIDRLEAPYVAGWYRHLRIAKVGCFSFIRQGDGHRFETNRSPTEESRTNISRRSFLETDPSLFRRIFASLPDMSRPISSSMRTS